jgi:hypothetical protein
VIRWLQDCPVTARTLQGMAPHPGQALGLALSFWPVWPRRLSVKCRREIFVGCAKISVWAALDAEGSHVTIQGPSPNVSTAR